MLKKKKSCTTNIVMFVTLEPILRFVLEIQSIPNYLDMHLVSAMSFHTGIFKNKLKKKLNLKIKFHLTKIGKLLLIFSFRYRV